MKRSIAVCLVTMCCAAAAAHQADAQSMTAVPADATIAVGGTQRFTSPDVSTAVAVSAGGYHACILLQNGELRCMGRNDRLQLFQSDGDSSRPLPMRPTFAFDPIPVTSVSAGGFHSCIAMADHTIECWGDNTFGQDGNPYTSYPQGPQPVDGITTARHTDR
jgi:alpha-tubulin suppressor-like RCC1 family protein